MRDPETGHVEADITINGQKLTFAQAMTVRVALGSFHLYVADAENVAGLGPIAAAYADRLYELQQMIHTPEGTTAQGKSKL